MKSLFKIRILYVYGLPGFDFDAKERGEELLDKEYDSYMDAESELHKIYEEKMKELKANPSFNTLFVNFKIMLQIEKYFVPISITP